MTPILALAMRVMMLDVVVLPPRLVSLLHFRPGARVGKRVVGEPALDRDYVELTLASQPFLKVNCYVLRFSCSA